MRGGFVQGGLAVVALHVPFGSSVEEHLDDCREAPDTRPDQRGVAVLQ